MANDILNEKLRMIYLTEDVFGIGQAIANKVRSLSTQTLTPDKIKQANVSVPPLSAIYDLVKTKLSTFNEAKQKVDKLQTSDTAKKVLIVSYAALKDLGNKDETLGDHIKGVIEDFIDFLGGITAATTETAIFMWLISFFVTLFKNPTWTVRILYRATDKLLAAAIVLIVIYALIKGTWFLLKKATEKPAEDEE